MPEFSTFDQLFTGFVPSKGFSMGALFRALSTNLLSLRWEHLPPRAGLAATLVLLSADKDWQRLS